MEKDGLVEELFIQGHAKVAGDAAPASSAPAAVSTASSGVAAQQPEGGRTAGCEPPHRSGGAGCRVSGGAVCTQWPDHLLMSCGKSLPGS